MVDKFHHWSVRFFLFSSFYNLVLDLKLQKLGDLREMQQKRLLLFFFRNQEDVLELFWAFPRTQEFLQSQQQAYPQTWRKLATPR